MHVAGTLSNQHKQIAVCDIDPGVEVAIVVVDVVAVVVVVTAVVFLAFPWM